MKGNTDRLQSDVFRENCQVQNVHFAKVIIRAIFLHNLKSPGRINNHFCESSFQKCQHAPQISMLPKLIYQRTIVLKLDEV